MSHLCTRCKAVMCSDCLEIAEEYEELLDNYKRANFALDRRVRELERDLAHQENVTMHWERIAKLGYPEVIHQWMDSLEAA